MAGGLIGERAERGALPLDLRRQLGAASRQRLGPHAEPLVSRPQGGQSTPDCGSLTVALGEAPLDLAPAAVDLGQLGLHHLSALARLRGHPLGVIELARVRAKLIGEQPGAKLVRLPLQTGVDVGGLSLALQRTQATAGLALDVEGPVEVLLGALQLQLRAPAALPVPTEARRLLDQEAAVAGLGVDDLLDPSLADHRVHLAAEVGVRERLDHVDQPAARPVQPVLALAVAVQPAPDRDLRKRSVGRVGVIEHHLDLGVAARRLPVAAGEDHVLHGLPADRQRALLTERPQHGVGDVRLSAAVRPHDHADPWGEDQPGALREGLEALDRDRAQMHEVALRPGRLAVESDGLSDCDLRRGEVVSYRCRRSSASAAAACSAAFLLRPSPLPITSASTAAATSKRRSWGGPASRVTS